MTVAVQRGNGRRFPSPKQGLFEVLQQELTLRGYSHKKYKNEILFYSRMEVKMKFVITLYAIWRLGT